MVKISIGAIVATLFIASAQAGVVYDEAVSGDLATQSSVNLGFSAGSNLVKGQGAFGNDGSDFDGFLFHLGAGQSLSEIVFTLTSSRIGTDTSELSSAWMLIDGDYSGALLSADGIADILNSADQSFFADALPLGAGTYAFAPSVLSRTGAGGSWNYEIEFFVLESNQVPEPDGLALFGLGLAGLSLARRKKKVA